MLAGMDAAVWTLIALLATLAVGNVWWLGTRIDQTNTRIDELGSTLSVRIDQLGSTLSVRIDETNTRIDQTNTRIDGLAAALDVHLEEHRRGA